MAKMVRLEKLNVVRYSNNPVKIAALKEDGYKVVEGTEPSLITTKISVDTEDLKESIEEINEEGETSYKYDDITVDEIKKILDEKGIEYDKKAKKEVLFALLV